jgi:hypothetical protein
MQVEHFTSPRALSVSLLLLEVHVLAAHCAFDLQSTASSTHLSACDVCACCALALDARSIQLALLQTHQWHCTYLIYSHSCEVRTLGLRRRAIVSTCYYRTDVCASTLLPSTRMRVLFPCCVCDMVHTELDEDLGLGARLRRCRDPDFITAVAAGILPCST